MELEICLCTLPKLCVSKNWTFLGASRMASFTIYSIKSCLSFPIHPQSSSKLYSSLGPIHRKTEIKQTPHICSRYCHSHDLLRMILPMWIRTIRKTVKLSHLLQEIPWDLHRHTSPLPCKWEVLAHTHEWRGQQWLVAIDLYFVPSCLQCFHTDSLKRARHLRRLEELSGRSVLGPPSFGIELNIFFFPVNHKGL